MMVMLTASSIGVIGRASSSPDPCVPNASGGTWYNTQLIYNYQTQLYKWESNRDFQLYCWSMGLGLTGPCTWCHAVELQRWDGPLWGWTEVVEVQNPISINCETSKVETRYMSFSNIPSTSGIQYRVYSAIAEGPCNVAGPPFDHTISFDFTIP
jgi:hypothetical protein